MIAYLDPSVLARAYLVDEAGHDEAVGLLVDPDVAAVTGTWTRIEVSGALVRAGRAGRIDVDGLLDALDGDLGPKGAVTVVRARQDRVDVAAPAQVRTHGLRAMDAWHLAVAALVLPALAEPGEEKAFATRDEAQGIVAEELGFRPV